jgi:uncharacterized membrane protein YadS
MTSLLVVVIVVLAVLKAKSKGGGTEEVWPFYVIGFMVLHGLPRNPY